MFYDRLGNGQFSYYLCQFPSPILPFLSPFISFIIALRIKYYSNNFILVVCFSSFLRLKKLKLENFQTKNRSNVGDRALLREIERAKQLSLNENKSFKDRRRDKNCAALDSNKENSNNTSKKSNSESSKLAARRQTKTIIISSQSDSDASQTHSTPNANVQVQSKNNLPRTDASDTTTNVSKCAKPADSDSDDEFRISPPVSSEQSSSESEFKLSQISSETSEERGVSSDEEFRLSSEEEFTPEKKVKPKVKQNKKSVSAVKAKTEANVNTYSKSKLSVRADSTSSPASKSSTTFTKSTCDKTTVGAKPAPSRTLKPSSRLKSTVNSSSLGQARTVNIPALLSSSQSSGTSHSPLGVKIGLSKNAKFKSLHANIKRQ